MTPTRVLLVDDDPAALDGLAMFLEAAGYSTSAVGSFEEARHVMQTAPPDLLITDVRLNSYNGLQLVISSPSPVPAIVITGFADPVLESEARRAGAAYVVKPVNPQALLHLVEEKVSGA